MSRHTGANFEDLSHYYETIIRSIREYACAVWYSGLSKGHLMLNHNKADPCAFFCNIPYTVTQTLQQTLNSFFNRRETLTKTKFLPIKEKDSLLHYLIPSKRNTQVLSKLRRSVNDTFSINCGESKNHFLITKFVHYCVLTISNFKQYL